MFLLNTGSDAESKDWTFTTNWHGTCIAKMGRNFGFQLELFELGHLGPGLDWTGSLLLEAQEGRRVELKE